MAIMRLGSKPVESIVKLKENGVAVDYRIVHQGLPGTMYDASCDGTWLLRLDCAENRQWNSAAVNDYANSAINAYLNGDWLNRYDPNIKAQIKQVKIPYRPGSGTGASINNKADGLSVRVFLLSSSEVGIGGHVAICVMGACLDYFGGCQYLAADPKRVAYINGTAAEWGLRDPYNYSGSAGRTHVQLVNPDGSANQKNCTILLGIRPALILPPELMVDDDGFVITNTAPETPASIAIPAQINGGSTVTVEWGAASDAEGNLEGYKVERSLDGGSAWTQIYQGTARSTTNLVPFGSESVMYRVKAYDTEGLESGWKTSTQVTVINNTAPTVPGGITVPEQVQGGQPLAIGWGASTDGENNLAGYSLERQVDGGAWAAVYSGPERSFTDAITKGWGTVAYRVRAYDAASAYSGFAVSETREVNNNTPPAIVCEHPAGTALGVKSEGFAVPYSVEDEEGDAVTVTESVDGTAWRTFVVELGAENSFAVDGVDFMKLLNGRHTLTIAAADGASSGTHSLSFEKLVTRASVTLERPMEADGPITVCVLAVSGMIPADAEYRVEVTNNALDAAPVWEDCTAAVRAGANIIFANQDAANGFAFNFRLSVERGASGTGGYITSVQGGFQGA